MKLSGQDIGKTNAKYVITADAKDLAKFLDLATKHLANKVKIPGFRPGKAPSEMIAKHADQQELQNEFLNHAVNDLYVESLKDLNQRVVGEPKIGITKFVPFSTLELSVEVPIVGDITIPAYSTLKQAKTKITITKQMIDDNLKELQNRTALPKPVKRAAKLGDMVIFDFDGSDSKTKESLPQATAENYRLVLGDNTFIPGFEEKLVGLSASKTKEFDLTFPKDYPDKPFASRKVTFKVTVKEVSSLELPKLDDSFAKTVGPFESVDQLKAELKKQLEAEADRQSIIDQGNKVLENLAQKAEVDIDPTLVDSEYEMLLDNAKKNALNRGQTWQEFLASQGDSEEAYQKKLKEIAAGRIKGGLAIGEVARRQGLTVEDNEIDRYVSDLKRQYNDPAMQAELDKPEARQELGMRLLTEKVINFIQDSK